jgi:hypothetical protein
LWAGGLSACCQRTRGVVDSCAGKVWAWAGARAATSLFVIEHIELELANRAAARAQVAAERLAKDNEKKAAARQKLEEHHRVAKEVWQSRAVESGSSVQAFLDGLDSAQLRKLFKFQYLLRQGNVGDRYLGFSRQTTEAQKKQRLIEELMREFVEHEMPEPAFHAELKKWILPDLPPVEA